MFWEIAQKIFRYGTCTVYANFKCGSPCEFVTKALDSVPVVGELNASGSTVCTKQKNLGI